MRVAVVHGYYSSRVPSGENVVVDLQVDALRRAGHDVEVFARRQDEVEREPGYHLTTALRVATGRGHDPVAAIDAFAPDVVHVHNLFPNFGRRWVRRYADRLVTTLHNFRPICPAATLFRDGHDCTLCPDTGTARHAVTHACFKDSRVATLPVALGTRFAADPLLDAAARVITLNDGMAARYAAVGVPAGKLVTVPNFVAATGSPGAHDGDFWLFVGRLAVEKGIDRLLAAWPADERLLVVGSGELEAVAARLAGPRVELLGQRPPEEVRDLLGRARGLLFPSIWPEGLPTVYLEALASGLPVLAWPESVVGELVAAEGTGLVATGALAEDLARARAIFPARQQHCRDTYQARYTERAWLTAIDEVYGSLDA
jgi:glycosyltransferase involved in cell wall biosynthesis